VLTQHFTSTGLRPLISTLVWDTLVLRYTHLWSPHTTRSLHTDICGQQYKLLENHA